jgi:SAM-dependent methyltransferase
MHETAYKNAQVFFEKYCKEFSKDNTVVDFGSYDVNGTLKPIFDPTMKYIGIDLSKGPNVDIVCSNRETPFHDNSIDVIISTSCLEHDDFFWMTFLEMCRVLKSGGFIYLNAPSAGPYHAHPGDCWRFYKDAWNALQDWAIENKYSISLVEQYIEPDGLWKDNIGVFTKQ